ncbi:MAG TPA: hypothetical protein VOB72_07875, partial [Candidatus Dormibacteraeota bacterium]|nr:hypothetical protein [Candidatus Dormibacteraeota bacterium]
MVYHLMLEARRPPSWGPGAPRDQHGARLRAALGAMHRDATLHWKDGATLAVRLRYEPDPKRGDASHQAVLAAVVQAADRAGLRPSWAMVTKVASHWTQGAIAGAVTGLGLSQTQRED